MSIRELDKIDFVSFNDHSNEVTLVISDEMDWESETEHLLLMQDKMNLYLSYIESGQVYEAYPETKGKKFVIHIYAKYETDKEQVVGFLKQVKEFLEREGYGFIYERVLPKEETKQDS